MNTGDYIKHKVILVSVFLGIIFSFLLMNVSVLIASLCQQTNGIEKIKVHRISLSKWSAIVQMPQEYLNNWSFISLMIMVQIIAVLIILYFVSKYRIQLFIIAKDANKQHLWWLNIIFGIGLLFFMFFSSATVSNISLLATIFTFCSSSVLIPTVKNIVNIPLIDVEIMDSKFMYSQADPELNSTDFIHIRAINDNENPQIIKFLGFCREEYIDNIRANYANFNKYVFLPSNEDAKVVPKIEVISPHAVSEEDYDIRLSDLILTLKDKYKFNEKKANLAVMYRNGQGNIFFKKFIVINSDF